MKDLSCEARTLTLATHPTARGIGWVLFESPLSPVDWAVVRSRDNAKCVRRLERIIERYPLEALVLEAPNERSSKEPNRVQRLSRAIAQLAASRGIEVYFYSRPTIRACFANFGAQTRYEIAQAIAAQIDAFRDRLPPLRKAWMSIDARLSLFDAAALAITHFGAVPEHE